MPGDGRVAMISGATRGIGAEIADALRAEGYALSLGVRRQIGRASCRERVS
jgi:short-subunit dehydrogenase